MGDCMNEKGQLKKYYKLKYAEIVRLSSIFDCSITTVERKKNKR